MSVYSCTVYVKTMRFNQAAIVCDMCNLWCHLNSILLSRTKNKHLQNNDDHKPWYCSNCSNDMFHFSNLSDCMFPVHVSDHMMCNRAATISPFSISHNFIFFTIRCFWEMQIY